MQILSRGTLDSCVGRHRIESQSQNFVLLENLSTLHIVVVVDIIIIIIRKKGKVGACGGVVG
jgi:hypothetical protein